MGLLVFLASVAINALIAIAVILGGTDGENEGRILGTSLLLSAGSIGLIANAAGYDRRRLGPVPLAAGATVMVGIAMAIFAVWAEPNGDAYYQWMSTVLVSGAGGTYMGLMSIPDLRPSQTWLRWAAYVLAALTSAISSWGIWEADAVPAEAFGVVGVLLAAVTVVLPVLSRLTRDDATELAAAVTPISHCPVCGASLDASPESPLQCLACGSVFRVEVLTPPGRPVPDRIPAGAMD